MTEELKQVSGEAETVADTEGMDGAPSAMVQAATGSDSVLGQAARLITPPAAGQTDVVRLEPGERFELAANPAGVSLVVDGNNLVLGFDLNGDGTPDCFVVLEDLVLAAGSTNPPVLMVAGESIGVDLLIGNALALSGPQTGGPGATLETAADAAGAQGTGATVYSDNLGDAIDLLVAQGVIPPVQLEFGLIELDDEIFVEEDENTPPQADPVLTPAGQPGPEGELPTDLVTALNNVNVHSATVTVTGSNQAGSVQYIYFTLSEPTAVTITTDGPTIDPHMFLFRNDGSLDAADVVASDDDDGLPAGDFFNAVINTGDEIGILPAGNYIVAVGDYELTLAEAVAGLNDSSSLGIHTGDVTVTISRQEDIEPSGVVFFKQLDVDGSIGDEDSGVIADFGGTDSETSLESLVFTLQSNPTFGQLIVVAAGGGTSYLTPGDTFSSEDTVWWIATEDQIADFLAQPGAPEFLPDVDFTYSATDEGGAVATAPVVITLPPPAPPRTALGTEQGGCLNEDTEGSLLFAAYPDDGASKIGQIVISGFPTGGVADAWVVDETSVDIFGYTLGVDYTADYDAAAGELTITFVTANFSLGASVQGTVDVTPNPDSDVDQTLTIEATAVNGAGSAIDTEDSLISVDADADSGRGAVGGADDGDADVLSVSVTVSDDNGDGDGVFEAGETGSVVVDATFDDFLDGSETHTVTVFMPSGFSYDASSVTGLPAGTAVDDSDPAKIVFTVPTDALEGTGSFTATFDVTNDSAEDGAATFEAEARAVETTTGDQECDTEDNMAVAEVSADATVATIAPPTVLLSLPDQGDCIEEDSALADAANLVNLTVTPDGDDLLTEIVISGFQSGWTYDFTGLDTDGGGTGVVITDNVAGDGTVTVTFDPGTNLQYIGTFAVQPPADTDEDHPTLSAVATVVDPTDENLSTTGEAEIGIQVDAVVDGGALVSGTPATSDSGAVVSLNLTLAPQGGNTSNPDGDGGDFLNGGGFDTDGSESITKVVVTLSGDAGAVLTSSDLTLFGNLLADNTGQVWTFEGGQADLVTLMATLQADPSDDFDGDITVTVDVTTTEFATVAGNPDAGDTNGEHGYECIDANNSLVESFQFTVSVDNTTAPLAAIGVYQADCLVEDTEGTLAFSADPQGPGDTITEIVVSGFPTDADAWTVDLASLQLDGLVLNTHYTVDFDVDTGVLTLFITGAAADATVTGTIDVTPNEDSDLDAALTINATAKDGKATATSDNGPTPIPVDAAADGGAVVEGIPGASTDGSVADLNLTLTPRGHVSGTPDNENPGGFDTDGSDSVTKVMVTLSGTGVSDDTDANLLFNDAGLTITTTHIAGTVVWTFEGSETDLVALIQTLQVDPADDFEGDINVKVDVTTTEFATEAGSLAPEGDGSNGAHGHECDDGNNSATETFNFTVMVEDGADPTGGTLSLTVDEAALDLVEDGDDLQAGTTNGTTPGSTAETDSGILTFTAGGDPVDDIYFGSTAGIEVRDEDNDLIAIDWTGNDTDTLVGKIGLVTVIVLELSGNNTAVAGGTANATVTATLTDAFPHADGEIGDVTITGIEVAAKDSDGDIGTGEVDVTVLDDAPEAGTPQTLILSNTLGLSGTADLDFVLGADGPGGFSLTKAMAADGSQTALVEGAAVYGFIEGSVQQLTSNEDLLIWHDNGDGSWSAVVTGDVSAVVFTVSANPDGTYSVTLDDEPLDGASSEFQLAFTSGVKGGNNDQLIFFDSTEPDANPADSIPDGSTIMALATAVDSDGAVGTVNSSTNGMGVSEGNTIDVNGGVSEKLFLDFGEPANPAVINGRNDPQFQPRLITFATITFNILDDDEFAIVGVYVEGLVDPVYFKVAGFGNGASAASDVFLTIDQGTTGGTSTGGTGTLADPYVVDMTGQFGTAYVDGSFATLEFQADVATGTDYRLLSVQGVDITSGTDIQTSFTAEAIDNDGDTAEAVVEVTFDSDNDLVGTAGSDVIVGDGSGNTVSDGAGNDIIIGGGGADLINLANNGDTDVLVYNGLSEAGDTLTGFGVAAPNVGGAGGDLIDLTDLLDGGSFTGTTLGDAELDGYVELFQTGGNVEVRVDLDGGDDSFTTIVTVNSVTVADLSDNIVVD